MRLHQCQEPGQVTTTTTTTTTTRKRLRTQRKQRLKLPQTMPELATQSRS
jgi:hypothetical protein